MPKPLVTGISPKEGYPGTKVTIRGEFLGKDETDLISVRICGVDCTLRSKWEKDSRIITYTGYCIGKGDIVVVTQSGGVGTSSVGFQGLVKKNIGPTDETCVWIDEDAKSILTGLKRNVVADLLHDNPLRISVEESSKLSSEFLQKEFPNSSIDITKENFSPMRFLLENYQNAKFVDLKSGLNYLKENVGSKTANSSDNLLKTNISSFMDAIKIMKDIHSLSSSDKRHDFSKTLDSMLKEILKAAHKIYDQDLESKDRADMIRNSLLILDTYKWLIYFPQNVEKYLKQDDYEQILNGYKLANIHMSKAEEATRKSKLFAQIKSNLDAKLIRVQQCIMDKLIQFPANPDEQKFLIEYFNAFEVFNLNNSGVSFYSDQSVKHEVVSPAWYCLNEEKKWIIQLMIECRDMHIADEKVSLALKQSNTNDASSSNSLSIINPKLDIKDSQQDSQQQKESNKIQAMTTVPHERNKFIEELCQMFFDLFTDYWRLGSMYLNNLLNINPNEINVLHLKLKENKRMVGILGEMTRRKPHEEYFVLVGSILNTFSDIVRAAFIPHTFQQTDKNSTTSNGGNLFLPWPIQHDAKIISQILPHCLRVCRMCALQINSLDIPPVQFGPIQNLIYDLRCECLKVLLSTPTREILARLGFDEEDWIIERDQDGEHNCLITNLPMRFEAKVVRALTLSKEFVLDDKKGEIQLFRDSAFSGKIAMLHYGILHAFLKRINGFMTKEDPLPKFVHMSRSKLLIYLYNNLTMCKKKILPNIWNIMTQHKYKQIDQVIKESKKKVKELQDLLLKQYMIESIGPIVDSIETNLYMGRYDFTESSPPKTVRNFIKLIIMGLLSVHSELFLLNKSLISVVFTYAVKEIYSKLLLLFSNIPQFGQQPAIQTYIDVFCLREVFKLYTVDESKEIIQKILKLIPTNSFEQNKTLMTTLISQFQKDMEPYIVVFHATPPVSSVSVSFNNNQSEAQMQQAKAQPLITKTSTTATANVANKSNPEENTNL